VKESGKRAARVAEELRQEIAAELRTLRDPRLAGVLVSRVEIDAALQRARVFVRHTPLTAEDPPRLAPGMDDPAARREVLNGLAAASGRLRREVARRMTLRSAPELSFFYDEGPDEQRRIEEILREIQQDGASAREKG
jgi:ribosome-binding factor A